MYIFGKPYNTEGKGGFRTRPGVSDSVRNVFGLDPKLFRTSPNPIRSPIPGSHPIPDSVRNLFGLDPKPFRTSPNPIRNPIPGSTKSRTQSEFFSDSIRNIFGLSPELTCKISDWARGYFGLARNGFRTESERFRTGSGKIPD